MNKVLSVILFTFLCFHAISQDIEFVQYASGLNSPVDIAHAGDERLFVVEQAGRIKIIDGNGSVLPTPFLNITSLIGAQDERGLLGLAFHPDYANNGYFFVNYTNNSHDTRVARYTRDSSNPNLADPNSAVEIITIDQPEWNHNGGGIKFGPDGYLYIGMGDGGSGNDPWDNSQNPNALLGKMLRIDVDNGTPYSIPTDNPFVNDPNVLDEIWALGLRNPWRFSFDRETGDLWIGDVGQNQYEEIDFQSASSTGGENYGWRCYEANNFTNNSSQSSCNGTYTDPVFVVQHAGFSGPCSITGGFVYRGKENPDFVGKYFCADYCNGEFYAVEPDGSGGWNGQEIDQVNFDISTFGEDANGELYCAALSTGRIYKMKSTACASLSTAINIDTQPCEGTVDNGSVSINSTGGTAPYNFNINPAVDLGNLAVGYYNITITDAGGCINNESFTLSALPLPMPTFSIDVDTLTVDDTYSSYQWLLNGTEIADATGQSFVITIDGNYSVNVTSANGCNNTSTETSLVTDLDVIPSLEAFNVTPNPFDKDLFLEILVNESTEFEMTILDNGGKTVFSKNITIKEKFTESIDVQKFSNGIYYLKIQTQEGVVVKKIVKQ